MDILGYKMTVFLAITKSKTSIISFVYERSYIR